MSESTLLEQCQYNGLDNLNEDPSIMTISIAISTMCGDVVRLNQKIEDWDQLQEWLENLDVDIGMLEGFEDADQIQSRESDIEVVKDEINIIFGKMISEIVEQYKDA